MKNYVDQVRQLRNKPEHVRRKIAIGSSAGITALVGLIWLVGHAASGTFALSSNAPATLDASGQPTGISGSTSSFSQLLGSAAASIGATSSAPALNIVDGGTTSTLDQPVPAPQAPSNATAIPF